MGQDEHYFGSLSPDIRRLWVGKQRWKSARNLTVQTLLGLDSKQVYKRLLPTQKARILRVLSRGIELGKLLTQPRAAQDPSEIE